MKLGVLRNRNFLHLFGAQTISEFGSAITDIAVPLTAVIVLRATPIEVGLLAACGRLPYLIFALAAGVIADRLRRGPLLIGSDIGRSLLLISIPVAYLAGHLTIYAAHPGIPWRQTGQIWPSAPLRLGNGSAEAVVDAVGPVSGRNRKHQLDHFLLVKVLAKSIEIGVVNVAGVADE